MHDTIFNIITTINVHLETPLSGYHPQEYVEKMRFFF
jgi:hypothetical protein